MNNPVDLSRREALVGAAAVAVAVTLRPLHAFAAPQAAGRWVPMPLISQATRDELTERGLPNLGGEGGQWIRSLAFGPDGLTAIWGTDVGGLFRSLDGGIMWEPCNVGFTPRGCSCVMFSPTDAKRILVAAGNSVTTDVHGLYLSTDRGGSWRHVLPNEYAGARDFRKQLAFDPTGEIVYWSRIGDDDPSWGETINDPALYRSQDAGETWERLPDSAHLGEAEIECLPDGTLLIAAPTGLFRSRDQAESFEQIDDARYTGLSHSGDRLYACREDAVLRSDDAGDSWQDITADLAEPEKRLLHVEASPADPDRVGVFRIDDTWTWKRFVSHDGGANWTASEIENDLAFLPQNVRHARFAWHATDPDLCLATGGDWPTRSTDGGRTFRWSAGGVNNILVGGAFQFCQADPDVIFVGSQDYNGGLSTDGGRTWTYCNVSGEEWGGFTYGGYAADEKNLWVGVSASWTGGRVLRISRDGGQTWDELPDVAWANQTGGDHPFGLDAALADGEAWFAGPFRSVDGGTTWQLMDGCVGVFNRVVRNGRSILVGAALTPERDPRMLALSHDGGRSWQSIRLPGGVRDASYDPVTDTALASVWDRLIRVDNVSGDPQISEVETPPDSLGQRRVSSVCHDPRDGQIVYATQHRDVYATDVAAMRSADGGRTWQVLTRHAPLPTDRRDPAQLDGGREAQHVRVHPKTGDAWFATGCYGIWRYAAG